MEGFETFTKEEKNTTVNMVGGDLLKYWRGFNPKYKNAFAYFTEIAKRGFAKGWNKIYPKKYHGTMSLDGFSTGGGETEGGIYSI